MASAVDQVKRLVQQHGNDLVFVVNNSGGKDSTRMLGFFRDKFPYSTTYAVMADTGLSRSRRFQRRTLRVHDARSSAWKLTVVRNQKGTYLEMVEQRGMFPSPQYRQCISDLKRGPIEKFIRSLPPKVLFKCMGHPGRGVQPARSDLPVHPQPVSLNSTTNRFRLAADLKFTTRPGASLVQIMEAHRRNRAEEARQRSFCFH